MLPIDVLHPLAWLAGTQYVFRSVIWLALHIVPEISGFTFSLWDDLDEMRPRQLQCGGGCLIVTGVIIADNFI